jgi:hypothetical protein
MEPIKSAAMASECKKISDGRLCGLVVTCQKLGFEKRGENKATNTNCRSSGGAGVLENISLGIVCP